MARKNKSEDPHETVDVLSIPRRTAIVRNVNFKPERHGSEWIARVDLSIEFVLVDAHEVAALVRTLDTPPDELLWGEGGQQFQLVDVARLPLDIALFGELKLSERKARSMMKIETAELKKIAIELLPDYQVKVFAQLRFDPTGHAERITQIGVDRECSFEFGGTFEESPVDEDDEGDASQQNRLPI